LRISTGFVVTNDNIPEAQVTLPDYSSYFIDFNRKSVSSSKNHVVCKFDEAPKEIQALFNKKSNEKNKTVAIYSQTARDRQSLVLRCFV
jgi:hypothetical protein